MPRRNIPNTIPMLRYCFAIGQAMFDLIDIRSVHLILMVDVSKDHRKVTFTEKKTLLKKNSVPQISWIEADIEIPDLNLFSLIERHNRKIKIQVPGCRNTGTRPTMHFWILEKCIPLIRHLLAHNRLSQARSLPNRPSTWRKPSLSF